MGNKFTVEVNESVEELRHRLRHSITSSSRERLQMLYWLKSNAIATIAILKGASHFCNK
jgi:hypothetical protein